MAYSLKNLQTVKIQQITVIQKYNFAVDFSGVLELALVVQRHDILWC